VAELRGRLAARRETGEVPTELRERLQTAVTELTEARTERLAAQQRLDRAERRARAARDERERRLRLTDRRDNLRRAVREHFLARLDDELHAAARAVPGPDPGPAATFDPRSLGDTTAALAVLRVATVSAPVVLACDRFERARAAATCLAAPVIRVE
jgi:regulator of replication initiation timing